ncbi:hypothetical protein H5410_060286 [Solanum commersonii]|uniref:Uncharacterized protein n=1 Tax=Solanum commersonii TaxID=4109 RepID=A0A9J5W5K7_SOLCO|nr:hypothetical protein H5410_060286 [Solanum commersonii]
MKGAMGDCGKNNGHQEEGNCAAKYLENKVIELQNTQEYHVFHDLLVKMKGMLSPWIKHKFLIQG